MSSELHPEAWRCVHGVRWRLLESYALARQEGLASPIGLIADVRHARAAQLLQKLLLAPSSPPTDHVYAGCVERGALCSALVASSPKLAELLFSRADEPGSWTALVLQADETVLSASWQELIAGTPARASSSQRSERRR